jgi:hypothetical protein
VQVVEQVPAEQVPVRHWAAAAQASPAGLPHRPSAAQTPAVHWVAAEHWLPTGSFAEQLPPLQKAVARHSLS